MSNTSGTYTFTGSGTIDGTTALTKTGAGTLAITNANKYGGGTTISGGTLLANNTTGSATGTGTVVVASGGNLGGTGRVAGVQTGGGPLRNVELQSGGSIQPGSPTSPFENLELGGSSPSLFMGGSTLKINVGSSLTQSSRLTLTDTSGLDLTTLSNTSKLNIELTAVEGMSLNQTYTVTVVDNTGTGSISYTGSFSSDKFNITASNFVVDSNGFAISEANSGNQLLITFTPVPEPVAVLGVAVAALGVGGFVRRRFRKPVADITVAA